MKHFQLIAKEVCVNEFISQEETLHMKQVQNLKPNLALQFLSHLGGYPLKYPPLTIVVPNMANLAPINVILQ